MSITHDKSIPHCNQTMLNTFWKVQFCIQNSTVLKNITEGEITAYHDDVSLFQNDQNKGKTRSKGKSKKSYSCTLSLPTVLDGGAWLKQRLGPYTPGKRCGTYCIGACVSPRANMDGCGKSRHHSHSIPGLSSP